MKSLCIIILLACIGCSTTQNWEEVRATARCKHRALIWQEKAHKAGIDVQLFYYKQDTGGYHAVCMLADGTFLDIKKGKSGFYATRIHLSETEKAGNIYKGYRYK